MQENAVYTCAYCGEENETFLDPGGGQNQEYVEDCQVCCRPNILRVEYDDDYGEVVIWAVAED